MQWPYKQWGASIVLSGHHHLYERILRDGLTYLINGLSGSGTYPFGSTITAGSQVRYNDLLGAVKVEASCNQMTFEFLNYQGTRIDQFTLQRTTGSAATLGPLTAVQQGANVGLNWTSTAKHASPKRSYAPRLGDE
jgi:hypothetical protein